MQTIRLAASALVTLIILGLAAILFAPSFAMPTIGAQVGLGRGALPQFCVLAGAILALGSFIRDVVEMRRKGSIVGLVEVSETAEPRRVVLIGFAALLLLFGYVIAWRLLGFPAASVIFLVTTSLLLLPQDRWNARGLLAVAVTSVLFGTCVWALFVHVLQVPLR
jgi:hypothetical protein